MAHFRALTNGNSVIMGRRTFDSLPEAYRPLPNRQNIVLSLGEVAGKGFEVARSLEEAYELADNDVHIIGGGQIYRLALPNVDTIHATLVDTVIEDADTHFPILGDDWTISEKKDFLPDGDNFYGYSFITYLRNHPIQ